MCWSIALYLLFHNLVSINAWYCQLSFTYSFRQHWKQLRSVFIRLTRNEHNVLMTVLYRFFDGKTLKCRCSSMKQINKSYCDFSLFNRFYLRPYISNVFSCFFSWTSKSTGMEWMSVFCQSKYKDTHHALICG